MTIDEARKERESINDMIHRERLEILELAKQSAEHVNAMSLYIKRLDEIDLIILRCETEQELKDKGVI